MIAFFNQSKAQVHKLTYREAYNFNVGDEIYYRDYTYYTCISNDINILISDKIIDKRNSISNDTFFYTIERWSLKKDHSTFFLPQIQTLFKEVKSIFYTNLDDTIIKLDGIDSLQNWITANHYYDTICNKYVSTLTNHHFEHWSDMKCIDGAGCYSTSNGKCSDGMYNYGTIYLGYKKNGDSCGAINSELKKAINFTKNCISAREIYDVQIGDEYIFERKIEGLPNEIVYRKVAELNYTNDNKSLTIKSVQKTLKSTSINNCSNCLGEKNIVTTIVNLDTCLINNDEPFNYDIENNYPTSVINQPCVIPLEIYGFNNYSKGTNLTCGSYRFYYNAVHHYIKGVGFLQNKKFTYYSYDQSPWYNQYPKCKVDTTSFRDTTETLLYIKNKFYNCGEMPDIFKRVFKNETESYVNILPNPVQFGVDVIGYKTSAANISSISFTDELGRFLPTVQKPICTEKEITFTIPHQYFHTGLNIVSFQFNDGHQEIHKIIVY
jgi:hypothetical protein